MFSLVRFLLAGWLVLSFAWLATIMAQESVEASSQSPLVLRAQANAALRSGDSEAAIQAANALTNVDSDQSTSLLVAADVYLRCGKADEAVKWFDRFLQDQPASLPDLWQRGIALYFTGDYKGGALQFEEHRKVNPHDVENAAWHFLCVAKSDSVETARRLVLPAPNDPRIPMEEVLAMLSSGDTESVSRRMQSVPKGSAAGEQAEFYGNFYLGLYADANGDSNEALRLLRKSAENAPHHYMGDIARVYVSFLQEQVAANRTGDLGK